VCRFALEHRGTLFDWVCVYLWCCSGWAGSSSGGQRTGAATENNLGLQVRGCQWWGDSRLQASWQGRESQGRGGVEDGEQAGYALAIIGEGC
jgi:hypothetical protein